MVAVVVEEEEVLVAEEEEGGWVSLHLDNMVQDESKPERNITLL